MSKELLTNGCLLAGHTRWSHLPPPPKYPGICVDTRGGGSFLFRCLSLSLELGQQLQTTVPLPSLPPTPVPGVHSYTVVLMWALRIQILGPQAWPALHFHCQHQAAMLDGVRGPACLSVCEAGPACSVCVRLDLLPLAPSSGPTSLRPQDGTGEHGFPEAVSQHPPGRGV